MDYQICGQDNLRLKSHVDGFVISNYANNSRGKSLLFTTKISFPLVVNGFPLPLKCSVASAREAVPVVNNVPTYLVIDCLVFPPMRAARIKVQGKRACQTAHPGWLRGRCLLSSLRCVLSAF